MFCEHGVNAIHSRCYTCGAADASEMQAENTMEIIAGQKLLTAGKELSAMPQEKIRELALQVKSIGKDGIKTIETEIDFTPRKPKNKRTPRLDLNPSSAERWTTCTISPKFTFDNWEKVPPDSDTAYNTEGTTAHEVAAAMLQGRKPNEKDKKACPVLPNQEMRRHAWAYMEYVEGLKSSTESRLIVEEKFPLWYMPERNAMIDAAVVNSDSLHIIDYKYGEGIIVSVTYNKQMIIYAYSMGRHLDLVDTHLVFLHVFQPRGRAAEDSPFHVWKTTWGEISQLAVKIELAAMYILRPVNHHNLKFEPSEKACQFCPINGYCTERRTHLAGHFKALGDVDNSGLDTLPPPKGITIQQLADIVKYGDLYKKWISDAQDYALAHLRNGGSLPGYKLVLSRGGNRTWTNPRAAARLLIASTILKENDVYEKKVISPAQVEKLIGKQKMNVALTNLIFKSPGSPTIADIDDPRKSYGVELSETGFSNLDGNSKDGTKVSLDQF